MLSQSIYLIFDVAPQVSSLYVMSGLIWLDYNLSSYQPPVLKLVSRNSILSPPSSTPPYPFPPFLAPWRHKTHPANTTLKLRCKKVKIKTPSTIVATPRSAPHSAPQQHPLSLTVSDYRKFQTFLAVINHSSSRIYQKLHLFYYLDR